MFLHELGAARADGGLTVDTAGASADWPGHPWLRISHAALCGSRTVRSPPRPHVAAPKRLTSQKPQLLMCSDLICPDAFPGPSQSTDQGKIRASCSLENRQRPKATISYQSKAGVDETSCRDVQMVAQPLWTLADVFPWLQTPCWRALRRPARDRFVPYLSEPSHVNRVQPAADAVLLQRRTLRHVGAALVIQ